MPSCTTYPAEVSKTSPNRNPGLLSRDSAVGLLLSMEAKAEPTIDTAVAPPAMRRPNIRPGPDTPVAALKMQFRDEGLFGRTQVG
jgi:hypothetical protein